MNDSNTSDGALNESDLENVSGGNGTIELVKGLGELAWEGLKWAVKKANEVSQALGNETPESEARFEITEISTPLPRPLPRRA